jgi:CRISPR-associated endonuclease/helicase Cas3
VTDAVATLRFLEGRVGTLVLHHSRYADHDRQLLDRRVLELLGPGIERRQPCVIVATQTCEQSLDIDADLLVSDACPADVLIQRTGRLHRHDRADRPPGCAAPRVLLVDPGQGEIYLTGKLERGQRLPGQTGRDGQGWA